MVTELLQKYIWLVQTFIRAGEHGLSLEEITDKWEMRFDSDYSRRTFNNHRAAVEEVFGIVIGCNRSTNRYFIKAGEDISDESAENASALYELRLTIGKSNARVVCRAVIENGNTQTLFFDISDFAANYSADYIRISVRALTQNTGESTLRIYDLCGYSEVYSNDELAERIEQQRAAVRNVTLESENVAYKTLITVVCIIVALVAVSGGLFMAFRKDDNKRLKK